jgi:hypothetical protein
LSALLRRPYSAEYKHGEQNIWLKIGRVLLTIVCVIAERLASTTIVGALIVAGLDVITTIIHTGWTDGITLVILHGLLYALPWYVSTPLHYAWDVVTTSLALNIPDVWRTCKNKATAWLTRMRGIRFEAGSIIDDETELLKPFRGPRIDILRDPEHEDTVIPKITCHGDPVTVGDVSRASKPREPKQTILLTGNPTLKNFEVTTGAQALVTALINRYQDIKPNTNAERKQLAEACEILVDAFTFCEAIRQWTPEEVLEHGKGRWDKGKILAYTEAFQRLASGIDSNPETAQFGGKSDELLRIRDLNLEMCAAKGRLVYFGSPEEHVGDENIIGWALGTKERLIQIINEHTQSFGDTTVRFFVPTGEVSESTEKALDSINPGELLATLSGDDALFRAALPSMDPTVLEALSELAGDVAKCDTTIRGPAQVAIFEVLQSIGLPWTVAEAILDYNGKAKEFVVRDGDRKAKFKMKLAEIINCSGNSFTTIITLIMVLLAFSALVWDGNVDTLKPALATAYASIGTGIEFEEPRNMFKNGFAPVGSCTFLAHYFPVLGDGRNISVPVSKTKSLVLKGVKLSAKGMDVTRGVAARSFDPELQIRPTHRAMADAMTRFAEANGVSREEAYGAWVDSDSSKHYRLVNHTNKRLSFDEELDLLAQHGVTAEMMAAEIRAWEDTDVFPNNNVYPVTEVMARVHYGLQG